MILERLKCGNDMKNMIRIEMKRAFFNGNYIVSLLIGHIIAGTHIYMRVLPAMSRVDNYLLGKGEYPVSLYNMWIGAGGATFQPVLFFMILPILCCMPYAGSCSLDRDCGYRMHILTKTNKYQYYFAKCVAVFLSGGTAIVIPLIMNLVVTAMFIPAVIPESTSKTFPLAEHSMWCELFYSHPMQYIGRYLFLIFLFAGLFALFGVIASFYIKNRYLVLLLPFIIYTMSNFILNYLALYKYSPEIFLSPDQPAGADFTYICIVYVSLFLGFIIILSYKGSRNEIYE